MRANLHSTAIGALRGSRAVSRVPHMRSTARPRRIGPIVELCMPGAPRPVPGTTAPPSGAAVKPPGAAEPPRGTTAPPSGARRYPLDAATSPRDDRTPFRRPPLNPPDAATSPRDDRTPLQAPAVNPPDAATSPRDDRTHPQVPPLKPPTSLDRPRGSRPRPPGTDARRNRHCGDGPLGIPASPNGPAAIPSGGCRAPARPSTTRIECPSASAASPGRGAPTRA